MRQEYLVKINDVIGELERLESQMFEDGIDTYHVNVAISNLEAYIEE